MTLLALCAGLALASVTAAHPTTAARLARGTALPQTQLLAWSPFGASSRPKSSLTIRTIADGTCESGSASCTGHIGASAAISCSILAGARRARPHRVRRVCFEPMGQDAGPVSRASSASRSTGDALVPEPRRGQPLGHRVDERRSLHYCGGRAGCHRDAGRARFARGRLLLLPPQHRSLRQRDPQREDVANQGSSVTRAAIMWYFRTRQSVRRSWEACRPRWVTSRNSPARPSKLPSRSSSACTEQPRPPGQLSRSSQCSCHRRLGGRRLPASGSAHTVWFVILHHVGNTWVAPPGAATAAYCTIVPKPVQEQLLTPLLLAPRGLQADRAPEPWTVRARPRIPDPMREWLGQMEK